MPGRVLKVGRMQLFYMGQVRGKQAQKNNTINHVAGKIVRASPGRNPKMEFFDTNLAKDSSFLLLAIHKSQSLLLFADFTEKIPLFGF